MSEHRCRCGGVSRIPELHALVRIVTILHDVVRDILSHLKYEHSVYVTHLEFFLLYR